MVNPTEKIQQLKIELSQKGQQEEGFTFTIQPIPGDIEVLQVLVENREELPIYISATEDEILCISYLFKSNEVKEQLLAEMHTAMLTMNISMPLSAFAKFDDQYVVFGALSIHSSLEDITKELEVLSDNTLEAIDSFSDYLS